MSLSKYGKKIYATAVRMPSARAFFSSRKISAPNAYAPSAAMAIITPNAILSAVTKSNPTKWNDSIKYVERGG